MTPTKTPTNLSRTLVPSPVAALYGITVRTGPGCGVCAAGAGHCPVCESDTLVADVDVTVLPGEVVVVLGRPDDGVTPLIGSLAADPQFAVVTEDVLAAGLRVARGGAVSVAEAPDGDRVLVFVEPGANLDESVEGLVHGVVLQHADEAAGAVVVTSSPSVARVLGDRVLELRAGRLVAEWLPEQICAAVTPRPRLCEAG